MRLLVFLKVLQFRIFFVVQAIFFVGIIFPLHGETREDIPLSPFQDIPLLPFEDPSPTLLLPFDDLAPGSRSSSPKNSHLEATIFEDKDTKVSPLQRNAANKQAEITRLLKELKFCADVNKAKTISHQIQYLWSESGSDTIDLLMSWTETAINSNNYMLALDYIDNIVSLFPNYAEAWVRRAWVHIQLSDFKLAMLDLNHAIELEPRNYIAFFELGIIMEATDRPHLAIKAYEKALYYYPQMQKLQKRVEFLLEKKSSQTL
ncbi:tetratricopeptide repeat protein [Bartonella sp. CB189]|uniref:tetratricopeptide repeat protein n=1 Tax=Bartonella sp. CB189 TaxID=3112254 RepID=UPI002F96A686